MDVWRRTSPGIDPRRDRDEGRVVTGPHSSESTRDTSCRATRPVRGVAFSGEVKWLGVDTFVSFAIAADTQNGVIGTAAVPFPKDHGLPVTPSAPLSAPRCATVAGDVSTADMLSKRLKRHSTTSIR